MTRRQTAIRQGTVSVALGIRTQHCSLFYKQRYACIKVYEWMARTQGYYPLGCTKRHQDAYEKRTQE